MSTITPQLAPERNDVPAGFATLAEAEAALRRQLFTPGCPPGLTEQSARIDARAAGRMRCASCHVLGLDWLPFHRGTSYKALAVCNRCGFVEEV
jgi:hypothetical protein